MLLILWCSSQFTKTAQLFRLGLSLLSHQAWELRLLSIWLTVSMFFLTLGTYVLCTTTFTPAISSIVLWEITKLYRLYSLFFFNHKVKEEISVAQTLLEEQRINSFFLEWTTCSIVSGNTIPNVEILSVQPYGLVNNKRHIMNPYVLQFRF